MKMLKLCSLGLALVLVSVFFACKKSAVTEPSLTSAAGKGSSKSTSNFGDYNIVLTSVSTDGKTWTYTITKNAGAKNLSHLIIDLQNCGDQSATFSDIVEATVNGLPADLSGSEGGGTGCNPQSTNFVKINFSAATQWVLVITFDRGYNVAESATAWVKAGTSCNTGTIQAPGCPKTSYCSYSQGYFFANGVEQNGALAFWANGVTIGGTNYSQTEGAHFWDVNTGQGSDQVMNSFFQLAAVRLSDAEADVASYAAIIDAYFTGLNVNNYISANQFVGLPASNGGYTKAQVKAAGSAIGTYIQAHHCVTQQ
jgi:hypothetical protein